VQRPIAVLFGVLDVVLDPQHGDVVLRRQIVRHGVHVVAVVADHADACHIEQVVLDRRHGHRQRLALELAEDRVHRLETAFHVMDGIMREPYLELRIKDLQFGAYLIHRAFVDLHEIHEFGEFFR